jgi:hypothetical protein
MCHRRISDYPQPALRPVWPSDRSVRASSVRASSVSGSSVRASDRSPRTRDGSLRASDRSLRASDRSPRASDRSLRASDRSLRASDRSLRASDGDRELVVNLLNEHTAAGRLTLSEFEDRVTAAYAAQTLADLDRTLIDLPPTAPPAHEARSSWWATPLPAIVFTGLICLMIWAFTSVGSGRPLYFWPMWVVGPWAAVALFRTAAPRGTPRRRAHDR